MRIGRERRSRSSSESADEGAAEALTCKSALAYACEGPDIDELLRRGKVEPKKWYEKTAWILLLWLACWPVGLVLALRSDWPRAAKSVLLLATLLIVGTNMVIKLMS